MINIPFITNLSTRRKVGLAALIVLLSVVTIQLLLIPTGMVSPRSQLDSKQVGFKTEDTLAKQLQGTIAKLTLKVGESKVVFSASDAGLQTDIDKTIAQLPSVQTWQRFVPFAPLLSLTKSVEAETVIEPNSAAQADFAAKVAKEHSFGPKDASPAINGGGITINESKPGQKTDPKVVIEALDDIKPFSSPAVDVETQKIQPVITEEKLEPLRKSFAAAASKTLIVQFGGITKEYAPTDVQQLLEAVQDTNGNWQLQIKRAALQPKLDEWSKQFNVPAGTTQVNYVDDVETSRRAGPSGRELDASQVYAQLNAWVVAPSSTPVALASKSIAPKVVATRIYTKSSRALQIKINDWIAAHSGQYQVAIQELGGQGRQASFNVAQQTVMASTYKLFLAFAAYKQSESGALNLSTKLTCVAPDNRVKTIEQSIEVAITQSNNECAIALGRYIGWAKVDQIIAASGFQNVKLNNYDSSNNLVGDKLVNAGELAKFLAQLSNGSLVTKTHTSTLLGYMKRQVYREGIPAGSQGSVVADKVGFLDGYLHDAGIVYSPDSTYALVIMSKGSSWRDISSLSSAIYSFMNE